jgi:hypothetical protein
LTGERRQSRHHQDKQDDGRSCEPANEHLIYPSSVYMAGGLSFIPSLAITNRIKVRDS